MSNQGGLGALFSAVIHQNFLFNANALEWNINIWWITALKSAPNPPYDCSFMYSTRLRNDEAAYFKSGKG